MSCDPGTIGLACCVSRCPSPHPRVVLHWQRFTAFPRLAERQHVQAYAKHKLDDALIYGALCHKKCLAGLYAMLQLYVGSMACACMRVLKVAHGGRSCVRWFTEFKAEHGFDGAGPHVRRLVTLCVCASTVRLSDRSDFVFVVVFCAVWPRQCPAGRSVGSAGQPSRHIQRDVGAYGWL